MLTQFIASILLTASLDACGSSNQNSQKARANESEMQTKTAPPIEPKTSPTPESVVDSASIGQVSARLEIVAANERRNCRIRRGKSNNRIARQSRL